MAGENGEVEVTGATDTSVPAEENTSSVDWDKFTSDLETDDATLDEFGTLDPEVVEAKGDTPPAETPPAPAAEVPPATPAAPAVTPPAATPPATPAVETPPAAAPVATPPGSEVPAAPAQIDYKQWRGEQITELEKHYALTSEQATELEENPAVALPKLAANLHMAVTETVMNAVQNILPQAFHQLNTSQNVGNQAKDLFYSFNEDLKDVPQDKIIQVGKMFRELNKDAKPEDAAKGIGNLVRVALGRAPRDYSAAPAGGSPAPVVAPTQTQAPAPFVPARGGGGGGPVGDVNQFTQLANEFLMEDSTG